MPIKLLVFLLFMLPGFIMSNPPAPDLPSDAAWIKAIVQKLEVNEYYWALDTEENLYVTGYFSNTVNFGEQNLTSAGNFDIFIAKYTRDGKMVWLKQIGGSNPDIVKYIKIDSNNCIYITGYFTGISFFEQYTARSRGRSDIFTAKYNSTGELQWVKSEGAEIICEPNTKKRNRVLQKFSHP